MTPGWENVLVLLGVTAALYLILTLTATPPLP